MNKIVLDFDSKRRDAVSEIADLVATTAGPYGQNVEFIGRDFPVMIRDGYQVLKNFSPQDDLVLGMKLRMQEAAQRTVRAAGDGSTTTTILLRWIYDAAIQWIHGQDSDNGNPVSRREIARGIRKAGHLCVESLKKADKIDIKTKKGQKLLEMVATLAGSNNPDIGKSIAEIIIAVGADGFVMTEHDPKAEKVSYEVKSGYRMPFGVIHNTMLPRGKASFTIQDAYVAITKDMVSTIDMLRPIIEGWKTFCQRNQSIFPLVVIAPGIDADALATLINRTKAANPKAWEDPIWSLLPGDRLPWFGIKVSASNEVWEDIESITGAKVFSSRENRSVKYFKPESGIVMPSVVIGLDECVLHIDPESLESSGLVARLRELAETADDRSALEGRIARLEGRVGVVKIPVYSNANKSWSAEVFEDAYLAAVSAINHGICPGAGKQLIVLGEEIREYLYQINGVSTPSFVSGVVSVIDGLGTVLRELLDNGGVPYERREALASRLASGDKWETILLDDAMLTNLHGNVPFDAMLSDGRATGVIDSAAAVSAAILSATDEAADWVETSQCVIPGSYKQ